jgi:uncharacterized membrane protein
MNFIINEGNCTSLSKYTILNNIWKRSKIKYCAIFVGSLAIDIEKEHKEKAYT